jgi:hypothetical protein
MDTYRLAYAIIAPRGVGPTRWSELARFDGKPAGHQIRRRFYLLGQTLEGQQIWDVRRAVGAVRTIESLETTPLTLQGKGEMAALALYAALFEPGVAGLDLWHPPASHRQGPALLNILTVLDLPQALALALPRNIRLHVKDDLAAKAWEWPLRLQTSLGEKRLQVRKVGD